MKYQMESTPFLIDIEINPPLFKNTENISLGAANQVNKRVRMRVCLKFTSPEGNISWVVNLGTTTKLCYRNFVPKPHPGHVVVVAMSKIG